MEKLPIIEPQHIRPLTTQYKEKKITHIRADSEQIPLPKINNNFEMAIDYYTKGLKENKGNILYLIQRANCYLAKGFYTLALKDALRTIDLNPKFTKGYYIATLCYLEMNDIENAEKFAYENNEPSSKNSSILINNNQRLYYLLEKSKNEIQSKCKQYKLYSKYLYFLKELYRYDSFFPKLEIHFYSDDHRGVIAKTNIVKDEVIMIIPRKCLITLENAVKTKYGAKISKFMYQELNSPKHCLLSSFILTEEKNEKWKFYFDLFPKDFSNFPLFYKDKDLELLKGSSFLPQIYEKKIEIKKDYEKLCEKISGFNKFSFNKFLKARMLISSRIFGLTIDNVCTNVLAPFADLLNHKRPRQTQWYYDNNLNSFMISALTDISQGEEVYDSYGQKSNSRFLLYYGFCLEDNEINEYRLTINFPDNIPMYSIKRQLIESEFDFTSRKFNLVDNIFESDLFELLSYLRFLLFDGDIELLYNSINASQSYFYEDISKNFYYVTPIDKDLEIRVLKYLQFLCRDALRKFPTRLEEDKIYFKKKKNLSFNARNCLLLVMSEKIALNFYIDFCDYCLSLFKLKNEIEIIEKVTTDFQHKECQFEFYIQEVIMKLID
ncbi:MAG: SET domain-containing protein-lysine N-methyltransferase [archaeon]|nr:SET domain-containing protein-lysine N-methyltransferase [archaeon]